ncbi:MAG: hypothetical protein VXW31_01355, partial [Planctomycetota bacterium]|nr:hypothetical protein [Planctomycetota bacterium]
MEPFIGTAATETGATAAALGAVDEVVVEAGAARGTTAGRAAVGGVGSTRSQPATRATSVGRAAGLAASTASGSGSSRACRSLLKLIGT